MTSQPYGTPDSRPINYQERDAEYVYRFLYAGESCSLVGIGSVGKSNLLLFLMNNDEAKKKYLGDYAPFLIMVLLDPHKIIHLQQAALAQAGTAWPGYEIMISRLRRALEELDDKNLLPQQDGNDIIETISRLYLNLFSEKPLLAQTGIRQLEEAVFAVMRLSSPPGFPWKIAFLFDEFEGFRGLPPEFFESLRGVRDEFKNRVMFVTTSRRPLNELVSEWYEDDPHGLEIMDGFLELFRGFTHFIRLLDRDSAEALIQGLQKRYNMDLEPANRRNLLDATGRHAGLLRRSFLPMYRVSTSALTLDQICDYLLQHRGILQECRTILDSLPLDERACLWQIARGQFDAIDPEAWHSLGEKHLVDQSQQGQPSLTLPLLRRFLMSQPRPMR
ncbi:MAG: hypothetical protein HXY41_15285 [Chloroflexi bacterium]|nr:hypothetical protein [Chloroflexota bacterium]